MNDQELEQKIQEAREAGYTEQQIQEYLASQEMAKTSPPVNVPPAPAGGVDRGEELAALGQYGGAKAAEYAAYGAGGAYAGKKILDAVRGSRAPVPPPAAPTPAPTAPAPGTPAYTAESLKSPTGRPMGSQPGIMQQVQQAALNALKSPMVQKATRGMGALGAMLYSPGLNANEDEELRRYRALQDEMIRRGQMR